MAHNQSSIHLLKSLKLIIPLQVFYFYMCNQQLICNLQLLATSLNSEAINAL